MIFVLFGVAIGALITIGPLAELSGPAGAAGSAISEAAAEWTTRALEALGAASGDSSWVEPVSTLVGVCVPGFVAAGLLYIAVTAGSARRAASGLLIVAAISTFWVLPAASAALLTAAAVGLVALAWFATGPVVQVPLAAIGTVLAVRTVTAIWSDTDSWISDAAASITNSAGTGTSSVGLWHIALSVAALAPIIGAAGLVLRQLDTSDGRRRRRDGD